MRWVVLLSVCLIVPILPATAAPSAIEERWDFYFNRINGNDASVLVDMGLDGHTPIKTKATLLYVLLPMAAPDTHGMGTSAEVGRVAPIEAEINDRVTRTLKARHVGRIRGEGMWQLYYYAPNAKGLDVIVRKAMRAFPKQKATPGHKADVTWKFYKTVLYPSAERRQWMRDRDVCARLAKQGDDGRTSRTVKHWAMFPNTEKQKLFEAEIVKEKFVVDERSELMDDAFPLVIRFTRKDPVDIDAIHIISEYLRKAAQAVSGKYDGWESPVVLPAAEEPSDDKPSAPKPTDAR